MAIPNIDFEGSNNQVEVNNTNSNTEEPVKQEDVTNLSGDDVEDVSNTGVKETQETHKDEVKEEQITSTGELNVGDQIEVDGITYTVAKNGDLVDDKGSIFKEAKDVAEWLKSVNVEDNEDGQGLTLSSIQNEIGIAITDENGNEVEFTNDAAGVKSYIDSVISLKSNELQQAAINRLYQDNPLLKQFQDYVQLTGTPRGFGDIPDRSGIQLDKDNDAQLTAVIKMAAAEFGNRSLNDNYIKYLKDTGGLYDEARVQLSALIEKDKAVRKEIETKAAEQRNAEAENIKKYWENVNKIVNSRVIGGYKIPESFTKEVNGKKIVVTANDFFDYISNATAQDNNGNQVTGYQKALNDLTDEEYLNRELLDAWLMFTGGTYKDLIDMAVKENEVRKLIVKSKENRSAKTVKVVKKQNGKTSIDDIIF